MLNYKEENLNFKNKVTTDCVVRAIAKARDTTRILNKTIFYIAKVKIRVKSH